jgi:serine/threonine protein kinase/Tol biopolymer transport system component
MTIATGTSLGRYEIRSHIGAGGMGEVYLAWDTMLDREIALKILPPEIASDQQRMQRFIQEAKTASALNHPNILTIYEIGETDATYFIATEFIDGVTLRQHMANRRLKLAEALDIASQIAAALTAAHAAGIVHRDVKPENIMLRKDGYAKLLDFGLAKPTERQASSVDTEAQTKMLVNTSPGMVMGTVSYMSPEQARGYVLDARTDIWSLGCVLYEMVAGRVPFAGETTSDVIVAVLDREPPLLPGGPHETPLELQRILRKALRKDKEERYQTVKDLLVDLRALKQEVDFEAKLEISVPPESRSLAAFNTISAQSSFETERAAHTSHVPMARTTLGAEQQPLSRVKPNEKLKQVAVLGLVFAFAAGATLLVYSYLHQKGKRSQVPFQSMKVTRLTATGKSTMAAISPDAKVVVYVVNDAGQRSIWVRQVATSRNFQIVEPAEVNYLGLAISPDSNYAYYVVGKQNEPVRVLYQISVLGGTPKKVLTDVDSAPTFSPDGKQFAFMRGEPTKGEYVIYVANTDGTGERRLASRNAPGFYEAPAWSPDGKTIAVSAGDTIIGKVMTVVGLNVEDGTERPITTQKWLGIGSITWLTDGSGLVIIAADQESRLSQLWHVSTTDGAVRCLTNDLNNYGGVSLARVADNLVTVRFDQSSNIWIAPATGGTGASLSQSSQAIDANRATQITSGGVKYFGGAWTPDGRIVYSTDVSGALDLWIMNRDGSNQKQLTSEAGSNFQPTVSPDGRYIFFVSDRGDGDKHNIWRMDVDGQNPKQLTKVNFARYPTITPDGKWIVYVSLGSKSPTLWKMPVDGGQPVQMLDKYAMAPAVSPDGKLIACYYWDETPDSQLGIAIIPFEGGAPIKHFNLPAMFVRWTPDGRGLAYVDNPGGVSNIWMQPIDGGKPVQLTDFKTDMIFGFNWSPDARQLGLVRGVVTSDVVLFSDIK